MPASLSRIIVFYFISISVAFSQKVEFEHILSPDGLASTNVNSIVKDSYGYMWFGTFSGLMKYDGYTVSNYLTDEDPNSSEKSDIRCIYETKDRLLLVGTLYGLCVYNRDTETFVRYTHDKNNPNSINHNRLWTIYEDRKGNLWVGTQAGLNKFNPKTGLFERCIPFKDKNASLVSSIAEDKEGNLWLYGGRELCKFHPEKKTCEYLNPHPNVTYKEFAENGGVLLYDKESNLWMGNWSDGLLKYNIKTGKKGFFSTYNAKLKSNTILSLMQDHEGNVWIGTDGGGLYQYKSGALTNYVHDPENIHSLSGNAVYAVYEGEAGVIWIGVYAGGVNVLKKNKNKFLKFTSLGKEGKKLSYKSVLSIAGREDGKIWLGTDGGGLNLFDPETFEFNYYTEENGSVCANKIKSLLIDKEKNLWCGTYQKGLCKIDFASGKKINFLADSKNPVTSIHRNNVWALCESSDDKIWIGLLSGGIDVYDKKTGQFIHNPLDILKPGHERNSVFALLEDSKKRMWLGAETAGIICYNPSRKSFKQFGYVEGKGKSIRSNEIRDIFEDSNGNIWFGTMKGGLSKLVDFEKGEFETYTMKDGLPSNNVLSILEDNNQQLWISTEKGLSCFKVKEKKFINFDSEDGLQSSKFINRSKYKDARGYMYFGGNQGLNIFHPDSIYYNSIPPPVAITHFKIFHNYLQPNESYNDRVYLKKSISQTQEIELAYDDFVFSVEFAALSFIAPFKNKYAYKLEGFDNEWTHVGADKRFATYTNLNPGVYTFRVIASNNDGLWNNEGASLKIVVLPPWWMTWWFKALVVLSILSGILAFIYLRIRSVKERNAFLQEEIKKQTRELKEVNSDLMEKNADISRKTARILEQQDEILKQKDSLEQLNKTKDKLFSIIAHDLRNPVNALTVLSKMLSKEFRKASGNGKDIIHNIEISSERIKSLLLNLLEWAKSQTGNIKVDPIKVYVHKLVEENIQLHLSQASHKNIKIQAEINPSHYIYADYNMASTIVRNILNNNIKYTPRGGEVFISSELGKNKKIVLSFKDTGIGMPKEAISRIFDSQSTFSTKGTENETGTGLGLLIAKEFVTMNFGEMEIKSEPEQGTVFYISLPGGIEEQRVADTASAATHTAVSPPAEEKLIKEKFKGKKVLVVDDDEQVRNSIKYILSDSFEVLEAMDAQSAITVSEENHPDMIISDIMMPGESGISVCQSVKSHKLTCHIPVILITGQTSEETHLESLMAGADSFITKPYDRKILLTTINNLLTNQENTKIRFSNDPEVLPSDVARSKLDEELLSKAIHFIENNVSDSELNGDALCRELGMSKSLLYLKIKNITGQTVNEFIRIIRLKMSTRYLIEGKLTIAQISAETGFNSPSYFSRSFTQHFGISPKDYALKYKSSEVM